MNLKIISLEATFKTVLVDEGQGHKTITDKT